MQKKCLALDSLELSMEVGLKCFAVFHNFCSCLPRTHVDIQFIVQVMVAI